MPWFSIQQDHCQYYRYAESEQSLLLHYVSLGIWDIDCRPYHPHYFNYKTLLLFFTEIKNALHNGLQLNEAIASLSESSSNAILSRNCSAIHHELTAGKSFNVTLSRLSQARCSPYCQLIINNGSREDCAQSIDTSIEQLTSLLSWSSKLLKGMTYPFFIMQVALIINLLYGVFSNDGATSSLLINGASYLLTSVLQVIVMINFINGNASNWFEKVNASFRLSKLLRLLSASRKTGKTLQQALYGLPLHFKHAQLKEDILFSYYSLQLGKSYQASFPQYWFPKESALALEAASHNGNIDRALTLAAQEHERHCQQVIYWFEKIIPAVCLFIAGAFVVSSLLSIYQPLLELP
ncbi:type II secretion system F family protein [Marinomonas pollencensis]|uniref:Protein transport protein HofC/type IV pilus assembly protein PilC n=1 Tax=Marinomonas pollencensis TaxID=491954 RepID=A0A3E0DQT3_9GAMM|nr:type II secretion system F family protein [Marinomonas pollencensis]REG85487.1 protein transport protein HofC/type IV pilus assembly protein PilC [Marinomonas pollencensis]